MTTMEYWIFVPDSNNPTTYWPLNLTPHETLPDVMATLAWQRQGGFPTNKYLVATYSATHRAFIDHETSEVIPVRPSRVPYTREVWASFRAQYPTNDPQE